MAKTLGEVLEVPAGTLIKGFKVNLFGQVILSTNGWEFEQRRIVKSVVSSFDRSSLCFTLYQDKKIQELLQQQKALLHSKNAKGFETYITNGNLLEEYHTYSKSLVINEGECIGMSLGQNIIAVEPYKSMGPYRPDFFDLKVFHKILYYKKIMWLVLQSNKIIKQIVMYDNPKLMDVILEIA